MIIYTFILNIILQNDPYVPEGIPDPDDSKPLSIDTTFDVILYIICPILIFIGYLLWRRRIKKRNGK